jgi:predicted N-acetyltransferase YhbS
VELADGLVLRTATAADVPGAARLLAERGEPADAVDLELVVDTDGLDAVAVVVDGERVVSTLTLLDEVVHIDGLAVPAGQVELVATDVEYERRGLVRALMDWGHRRSRDRGHLLNVMIGIPYFYRQFGYTYSMPMAPWRPLGTVPDAPADIVIREATEADIPAMQALQDQAQSGVDIRMGHTPSCWQWLVRRGGSDQLIAERDGTPVGVVRMLPPEEGSAVTELAAGDQEVCVALLAHARSRTEDTISVQQRPAVAAMLEPMLEESTDQAEWYYARIERLAPLLQHLAPVLQQRLHTAGMGDEDHEVLLSTWRSHIRFTIGASGFRVLAEGGVEQAPVSKGGSGIPPDAIPPLLLGPYGALGLEERLPDCFLGRQRELMAALFPPRTNDVLTFYVPL